MRIRRDRQKKMCRNCAANPQHFAIHHRRQHHVANSFRQFPPPSSCSRCCNSPSLSQGREDHPCEKVFRKRLHSPFEVWSHLWAGNGARWEVEMRRVGEGGRMIPICHFFRRWVPQKGILCSQKQVSRTTLHVRPTDVDSCGEKVLLSIREGAHVTVSPKSTFFNFLSSPSVWLPLSFARQSEPKSVENKEEEEGRSPQK